MFAFSAPRPQRRPSLTPMIDVVFLLLVFFMLAARFGVTGAVPLSQPGAEAYAGPPRLVTVGVATLALNGVPLDEATLLAELSRLTAALDDAVVLRAAEGVDLQRLVDVIETLRAGGFTRLVVAE
ncbi:ExbD/TolR family protein [Palleronia sp. KMU-117]|uniref:ExbD/TolR family protein n=1 Tax=Palleronia sp. KMU-117 TaxID=3434108 RepID=UPI003D745376